MAANWYDVVYLDRLVPLTGRLNGLDTQWDYPAADTTIDTVVLGPDFGANAGDIKAIDTAVTSTSVSISETGVSWDESEKQISKTGAFSSYTWVEGDVIEITGGTDVNTGTYEITAKVDDNTLTLAEDITSSASDQTDVTTGDITTSRTLVTVTGEDLTAGEVAIGRAYTMSVELTRPFWRDRAGHADTDARLFMQRIIARYHKTGGLRIRVDYPEARDAGLISGTYTEDLDVDPIEAYGNLVAWFGGDVRDMTFFLENLTPKPSTVTSVEFIPQYSSGVTE